MKLEFLYVPTTDVAASLQIYRDVFGATELWREGDATVALSMPGSDVQIMLDRADQAPAGPLFTVDSVRDFHAVRGDALEVVSEPSEIPDGFMATYRDAGGTTFYLLDQSTASAG
jgi:catechol 2,3-dioxygenase-like lactoylglutathione lyase family enzyme